MTETLSAQTPLDALLPWLPLLLQGFELNLAISFLAMTLGILLGITLSGLQSSQARPLVLIAKMVSLFLRNSPWLVILFYGMFVVPFQFKLFGVWWRVPDWIKAVVALSLPTAGYMAEIIRGGLKTVAITQWEAAAALGYSRTSALTKIVLPQASRQMIPPTMNLYCTLAMATSLANIVGVQEVFTVVQNILTTEQVPGMILPAYGVTLFLFFIYIFPLSLISRHLERRWSRGVHA